MKQARVLTEQEIKRVLAVIEQEKHAARNRMAIMLSFYAGMRVGEIAQLQISNVFDCDHQPRERVMLSGDITKGGYARIVFVNDRLKLELERYFRSGACNYEFPYAPLIRTQKRTSFSPNTMCQLFSKIYAAAGLEGASSHSGRRWFITKLAHSAVSPKVIMTLAGHRHLTTTQRYIDVNDEMMRAAVSIL